MNQQEFIQLLNQTAPTDIVNIPQVKQKYVSVYDSIWKDGGEAAYQRESRYFSAALANVLASVKNISHVERFSIYNAFVESAITNLSLEPGVRALAYLTIRNAKSMDANGREVWITRVNFAVSGYGEMVARVRCGQIRHADNPVVVYDNDELTVRDTDGRKSIEYVCHFPHTGRQIVACYMRITRADGSIDYATMYEEDWVRLAGYSEKQNGQQRGANALYKSNSGQIDPGFLQAKLIKHAFKTYPKVKIGAMAIMAEEDDEAQNLMQYQEHDEPQFGGAPWDDAAQNEQQQKVSVEMPEQIINPNDEIF